MPEDNQSFEAKLDAILIQEAKQLDLIVEIKERAKNVEQRVHILEVRANEGRAILKAIRRLGE